MVPPRVDAGRVSRYSLRSAARTRSKRSSHAGKCIFSVDTLYNILKDNPAAKKTRSSRTNNSNELKPSTTQANAAKLADSSDMTQPAVRKSARLFNKRAAELQLSNPGVPQYWLRTRSKRRRPTLVSIKSLYPGSDGGTGDSCSQLISLTCSALQRLSEDLLHSILERLPPANLLEVARVCKSWARLCETIFKDECHVKRWSLPRMPRGVTPAYPWRSLYYRHACRACGKVGEFFVREILKGSCRFLMCGSCIRQPEVRCRLVQYSIDLYGVTGKLLIPNFNYSKSSAN